MKKIVKDALSNDPNIRRELAEKLANVQSEKVSIVLKFLAHDVNELVRAEAYDSLSFYSDKNIEKFLRKSIQCEKSKIARNYAIIAWFDVLTNQNKKVLSYIKKKRKKEKKEICQMSWSYCYYALTGNKIKDFLKFLNSKDYHVQCATLNMIYYEKIYVKDKKKVIELVKGVKKKSSVRAVKMTAEQVLKELKNKY